MKNVKIGIALVFIQLFTFSACKNEIMESEDIALRMSIGSEQTDGDMEANLSELSYTLCLFRAPNSGKSELGGEDFELVEIKQELNESEIKQYSFKVNHSDQGKYAYRIFVHATPAKQAETSVSISQGAGFDELKISWVIKDGAYVLLSKDNYCDYQTVEVEDLSKTIQVSLKLKRIVGRLVFDVFKSGSDNKPMDIASNFTSTLDRVSKIDMLIDGITTEVKPSGEAVTKSKNSSVSLSLETILEENYHLKIEKQNSEYFAKVEKKDADEKPVTPKGGVRLYSVYLLPTGIDNDILKAKLTFSYWDELPGISPSQKQISLQLPSSSPASYLRVVKNYYTLTNIRLKHNRIIDSDVSIGIDIDTSWDYKND